MSDLDLIMSLEEDAPDHTRRYSDPMELAMGVRDRMLWYAQRELSVETFAIFEAGLSKPKKLDETSAVIEINGFLPTALEEGLFGFDMKPFLLASPKAKTAKDGSKYLAVPVSTRKGKHRFSNPYSGGAIRVVSSKSPSWSWLHPGIPKKMFFDRAIWDFGMDIG